MRGLSNRVSLRKKAGRRKQTDELAVVACVLNANHIYEGLLPELVTAIYSADI